MANRHKVFVSYHHANDQSYKNIFNLRFGNAADVIVKGSVELGDIDASSNTEYVRQRIRNEYLSDSSVTVVLVGVETWQRKHVDWEIYASLRDTTASPRSGLLGILLPSYAAVKGVGKYSADTLPPRLADNLSSGYAKLYNWSEDAATVQEWIHDAYLRKDKIAPNNARRMFGRNWSGTHWTD